MEKRGQQMTLSTIIIIVLGIAVLVFLIFGFSTGWNNLWNRVTNLGGGSANVDTITQACSIACTSNSVDAFCRQSRTVNYGDGTWEKGSCFSLKGSTKITIDSCSITCTTGVPALTNQDSQTVATKTCNSLNGQWANVAACPATKADLTVQVTDISDKGSNTKCCAK